MLVRVLLAAIFAGVLAGVFATAVQAYRVGPLILEAETYEVSEESAHSHDVQEGVNKMAEHDHDEAFAPEDGFERIFYTGLSNVVVGVAFSLIVTAAILITNQAINIQSGLVWGACGFAVFVLAPNFGLPPELPGMQGGDLHQRQLWWLATVILTASGLALFAFKRGWLWMVLGVVFIVAPHMYGAPQPLSHDTSVPANLAAEFAVATIVASALFWLFLGSMLGIVLEWVLKKEEV